MESTATNLPNLITAKEAAQRLHIAKATIYQWIALGQIPAHRFGRMVRIDAIDLENFIAKTKWDAPIRRATDQPIVS